MDGSNIYGVSCQEAETVRDREGNLGLLRVVPLPVPRSDRMPISPPADPGSFCRSPRPSVKPCFLFADFRDNENPSMYHMYDMLFYNKQFVTGTRNCAISLYEFFKAQLYHGRR